MRHVLAIALAILALVAPLAAHADPPSLVTRVGTWVYAAELRPLDADLDDGSKIVGAIDARLAAINGELGPLAARSRALGGEIGAARKVLAELRTQRAGRTGDNDDRARALDSKIEALSARLADLEKQRDAVHDQMGRLSQEATSLMDGAIRIGDSAAAIAEEPKADGAKKRKATALAMRAQQIHQARLAFIRTLRGATPAD
jgi:predicted  nucleic acid-binding Zn-ribbon protein